MTYKNVEKKHECNEIHLEKAVNGWIIRPSYAGVYSDDIKKSVTVLAATPKEVATAVIQMMDTPYVITEREYVDD